MAQYMLLLYDNPSNWVALSPEETQRAIEKYIAWARQPFTLDSKRLDADCGRVVRRASGHVCATDGPFMETKEILGGYYTIEAANYDEAVARAKTHPHVEYGGVIEIRQVYGCSPT